MICDFLIYFLLGLCCVFMSIFLFLFIKLILEGFYTGKKVINSDEYDKCLKRLSEVNTDLQAIKSAVENLRTDLSSLRGKFNIRLRGGEDQQVSNEKIISDEYLGIG